jgi:hypothetical protein
MSGIDHKQRVRAALESAFPDLTSKQVMAIIGFAKLVRFRARSNAALYNLLPDMFGKYKAKFAQRNGVTKYGKEYTAIECTVPVKFDGIEKPESTMEEPDEE